jgi:hypothetical protein
MVMKMPSAPPTFVILDRFLGTFIVLLSLLFLIVNANQRVGGYIGVPRISQSLKKLCALFQPSKEHECAGGNYQIVGLCYLIFII